MTSVYFETLKPTFRETITSKKTNEINVVKMTYKLKCLVGNIN